VKKKQEREMKNNMKLVKNSFFIKWRANNNGKNDKQKNCGREE